MSSERMPASPGSEEVSSELEDFPTPLEDSPSISFGPDHEDYDDDDDEILKC